MKIKNKMNALPLLFAFLLVTSVSTGSIVSAGTRTDCDAWMRGSAPGKAAIRENPFFSSEAIPVHIQTLQWYALDTLSRSNSLTPDIKRIAAEKLRYYMKPIDSDAFSEAWFASPSQMREQNSLEYCLQTFIDSNLDHEFRSAIFNFLKSSPLSDSITIEHLIPIAGG